MSKRLEIEKFIDAAAEQPVFDVRSPSEFEQGHIPGAHSIPLFDDGERAEIGKLYKEKGRDAAFKRGLEFVGPKMRRFVEEVESISGGGNVLVHCWRGGMRSRSFAWLMEQAGISTAVLEKGYKAFRNFVLRLFARSYPLIVLGGMTGSGKTEVLHALRSQGEPVIDLEGLANHKGSAFGHLGEEEQPTGEQFENNLGMELYRMDPDRPIWIEDESQAIGARILPKPFFASMREAPVLWLEVPLPVRIERLVTEYGDYDSGDLEQSIRNIRKRLGGLRTQQALDALEIGELDRVAEIVLGYYDKTYRYGLRKRPEERIHTFDTNLHDPAETARRIRQEVHGRMELNWNTIST